MQDRAQQIKSLERLLPKEAPTVLDASDFAAIQKMDLRQLNSLIGSVGHELYQPAQTNCRAIATLVSLLNMGLLSLSQVYGTRQYA